MKRRVVPWHRRLVLMLAFLLGVAAPIRGYEERAEEETEGSREVDPEVEKIAATRAELRAARRAAEHSHGPWSVVASAEQRLAASHRVSVHRAWQLPRRVPPSEETAIG
ncbi:MAG TPA: hypothetical protein VG755_44650 [Nannocystaceae bacterium]|nr:hypothetical protein [Nannocystaceae bacterium]